jgi:hypothetical protein
LERREKLHFLDETDSALDPQIATFSTTILPSKVAAALTLLLGMIALQNLHLVSIVLTPKASSAYPKLRLLSSQVAIE